MKNWDTLDADVVRLMNKNFTRGRGGKKIDMIVLHHNAGILTIDQIWQVWQTRPASAHYQVESGGRTGQLVWDRDTAHHAANWDINQRSIGVEISNSGGAAQDWPIAAPALEEGAHLVAAICRFYKLGRPAAGRNVRFHREFTGTSCPHALAPGGRYHDEFFRRAGYWYDHMTGKTPTPPSASSSTPKIGDPVNIIRSLVNSAKSFTQDTMLALIDRATWEIRVIVNELARKQGIDPDKIVADAIRKDNEK